VESADEYNVVIDEVSTVAGDQSATQEPRGGVCHALVGQGVKITGRPGVYVVLRADAETGTADVLLISGIRQIESGVPLGLMHLLVDQQRADGWNKLPVAG
jgi:hypothetical protein